MNEQIELIRKICHSTKHKDQIGDILRVIASPPVADSNRPRIVCICGSSRFCDVAAVHAWNFEKMGIIAIGMHLLPDWYWKQTGKVGVGHGAEQEGVADVLDELHLHKIEMADEVFVVNESIPGHENGYIGVRTATEISYALSLGKPVRYSQVKNLKP